MAIGPITPPERPRLSVACGAALLAVLMASACKPAAFASHEADLLRTPPPRLPAGGEAYWNDRTEDTYGELIVGAGNYLNGGRICRTARVTQINDATHAVTDRTLLYCQDADGSFMLDASLSCRPGGASGIICRTTEGDDVTLPLAGAP